MSLQSVKPLDVRAGDLFLVRGWKFPIIGAESAMCDSGGDGGKPLALIYTSIPGVVFAVARAVDISVEREPESVPVRVTVDDPLDWFGK